MSSSLESKLLGDRADNYCSSSEDEHDDGEGEGDAQQQPPAAARYRAPSSTNTGPKGVLEDWRKFKQLQNEQRDAQTQEYNALAKRLALTCRTEEDDNRARLEAEKDEDEDDFLSQYRHKRMLEIKAAMNNTNKRSFGKVFELVCADDFLKATEDDCRTSLVIIHIYEKSFRACVSVSECLECLATEFTQVKFCQIRAAALNTSDKFKSSALPTIQAYRNGELVGNFIRISDELGDDFEPEQLLRFLREFGVLNESNVLPSGAKMLRKESESDSDFEID